ncbi:MAG TPA: SCO family protein [Terriglobia bacterium]|nr:SCO family protein [Terriglobia bacterium]
MACESRRNLLAALAPTPGFDTKSREKLRDRYFPNVELTTHEGKKVHFYDDLIKDKIVVINFMYADCEGICPAITSNLAQAQRLLGERVGRDIFMYSLTLRPEKDTPEALKHYAKMHGVKPGWLFLTGKPEDLEKLRRSLGFSTSNLKLDQDRKNHIGMVKYGNERREWWGMCPGKARPGWIVESILWMDDTKQKQFHKVAEAPDNRQESLQTKGVRK